MRRLIYAALLCSCALMNGKGAAPRQTGNKPSWVGKKAFYTAQKALLTIYATGQTSLPSAAPGACPRPNLIAERAAGRARAQMVSALKGTKDQVTIAKLKGATPKLGWFDGQGLVHVLLAVQTTTKPPGLAQLKTHTPSGGVPFAALEDQIKDAHRRALVEAGVCDSPHQRPLTPCCGPPNTFCSDSSRYSKKTGATCGCGPEGPCLYDYKCEPKWQRHACICRGEKCPCEGVGSCRAGQTCGDGRCY